MSFNGRYGQQDGLSISVMASAPTTSTAGYLGQVIFDTNGNKWTLLKIDGSDYYWSPDGFPADNTEYPAYVENGVVVWKVRVLGYSGAAYSVVDIDIPVLASQDIFQKKIDGWMNIAGHYRYPFPVFFETSQLAATHRLIRKTDRTGYWYISVWVGPNGNTANKSVIFEVFYAKI